LRTRWLPRLSLLLGLAASISVAGAWPRRPGRDVRPVESLPVSSLVVILVDDYDVGLHELLVDASRRDPSILRNFRRVFVQDGDRRVGTEFTRAYTPTPICCPARASFLTGQYTHNHGVNVNEYLRGLSRFDDRHTIATWLDPTYYTGFIGKYLAPYGAGTEMGCNPAETPACSPTYVPPGWDDWQGFPEPTLYRYWGFGVSDNGNVVTYQDDPEVDRKGGHAIYSTDVMAERAVDFLDDWEADHRYEPFFLVISTVAPHVEVLPAAYQPDCDTETNHWACRPRPAARHRSYLENLFLRGTFRDGTAPASFNELSLLDKPRYFWGSVFAEGGLYPRMTAPNEDDLLVQLNARGASMLAVDDLIGTVFDRVQAFENPHPVGFVFLSDQGYISQGEHRMNSKVFFYEESIRFPMFVRPARQTPEPKAVVHEPVLMNDFAATFLAVAGARADRPVDGRSFLPLLDPANPGPYLSSWGRTRFFLNAQARRLVDEEGVPLDPWWVLLRGIRYFENDRFPGGDSIFINHRWYSGPTFIDELGDEYYRHAFDPSQMSSVDGTLTRQQVDALLRALDAFATCAGNDPRDPQSCYSMENRKP
jgi:arylsulfatase A-like enzyme